MIKEEWKRLALKQAAGMSCIPVVLVVMAVVGLLFVLGDVFGNMMNIG